MFSQTRNIKNKNFEQEDLEELCNTRHTLKINSNPEIPYKYKEEDEIQ